MRLDQFLVEHHLVKSRSQGQDLIRRGLVTVDGEMVTKTGYEVHTQTVKILEISRFVSRSGEKLLQAIVDFRLDFHDKIVVDIGSSTGGFTDCALKHGAKHVYAYDVGYEQMDKSLKADHRISLYEQTNILDVTLPKHDLALIDVSFTSIKPIITHIKDMTVEIVGLIKPQFEAGHITFKQGVLKDKKKHKAILEDIISHVMRLGFYVYDLKKSQLLGKQGNQEYLIHIKKQANHINTNVLIGSVI